MLYQHQVDGAAVLAERKKLILGDVPGLGKTRTLLSALSQAGAKRPLIVCPAIVRTHWQREAEAMVAYAAKQLTIKSYDEITRGGVLLMKELLRGTKAIDSIVLDEAHYLKNGMAKRTKMLLGTDGYARRLPIVFPASGTPMPKNPAEIWTILASTFPEIVREYGLRRRYEFVARFCVTRNVFVRGHNIEKVVGVKNEDQLQEILSRVMLRRTLADVGLDVPELIWQKLYVDGDGKDFGADLTTSLRITAAVHADDLASIAADPAVARARRHIGELKVAPIVQVVLDLLENSDEKIVLFAHHRSVLAGLCDALKGYGVAYIDGDVAQSERASRIDRFQTDAACRVFIGQNIACQTGITLTAASRAMLVEPDWTAVTNAQLGHRVARIGQTAERCVAQMVVLAGTLDEAIVGQHYRETRMVGKAMGEAA